MSAPYLRLKMAKGLQNDEVLLNLEPLRIFLSHSAKKNRKGDPLVSSRIVCYEENVFGSVPCANKAIKNFVELLVELFWSLQVYRQKTLTKSHDVRNAVLQSSFKRQANNKTPAEQRDIFRTKRFYNYLNMRSRE